MVRLLIDGSSHPLERFVYGSFQDRVTTCENALKGNEMRRKAMRSGMTGADTEPSRVKLNVTRHSVATFNAPLGRMNSSIGEQRDELVHVHDG